MKTILYARVSTSDQTIEHQRTQAEAAGFTIDEVVADDGVSGLSTSLADRQEGRRLFDLLRAGDTLVETVYRIKYEPAVAEAALMAWDL